MSAVGAIASTSPKASGLSSLSSEQFLGIILKELSAQDPLQPSETKDLLEQLSTVRSIQSNSELVENLQTLVGDNQWASAGSLIGRSVSGLSDAGERLTDRVAGVSRSSDGPILTLAGGQRVRLARVDQILEPPKQEAEGEGEGEPETAS